jgi:hypothetical protein
MCSLIKNHQLFWWVVSRFVLCPLFYTLFYIHLYKPHRIRPRFAGCTTYFLSIGPGAQSAPGVLAMVLQLPQIKLGFSAYF